MARWVARLGALLLLSPLVAAQSFRVNTDGGLVTGVVQGSPLPPRDTPPAPTGTSVVRGRIIDGSSGAPLRKVTVRISGAEIRGMRSATTDPQGRYEFVDLPAGQYNVSATKTGYVDLTYGQTAPFEPGKPLRLADKQVLEKIDLALPHGAVISGRVLDEYGDPIADVQVGPVRNMFTTTGRRPTNTGRTSTTNDIGEFRLFGLAPGEYYVSATARPMFMGGDIAGSDDRTGYSLTYYPGTANFASAQKLNVSLGGTVTDVTIMLVSTRTATVTGRVVDAQGQPVRQGSVNAMSQEGVMVMSAAFGQIRPDGTFTIGGLPPGQYMLRGMIGTPTPGTPPPVAVAPVTVNGQDLSGIQLEPLRSISVRGHVVLDPVAARSFKPSSFRFTAAPVNPSDQMMLGPATSTPGVVNEDLTFEFKAYPGNLAVRMMGVSGWAIKSVSLNGTDVTDSVTFRDDNVSGLEIELTNRVPVVSGAVTNSRGELVKDAFTVAFLQNRESWSAPGIGRNAMVRSDDEGRFQIRTLKPGDYYVVAVTHLQNGQFMDPEFLESIRAQATRVTLVEGDAKTIDLKLVQ